MAIIPPQVAFEQARKEIAGAINYCIQQLHVEPYMVDTILQNFAFDFHQQVEREYQTAFSKYQQELQAEQEQTENQKSEQE